MIDEGLLLVCAALWKGTESTLYDWIVWRSEQAPVLERCQRKVGTKRVRRISATRRGLCRQTRDTGMYNNDGQLGAVIGSKRGQ